MKKIITSLCLSVLVFSFNLPAQDWVGMMRDPNVNVHDVQKAFYQWYDEKHKNDTDNAGGQNSVSPQGNEDTEDESYELFKRWEWFNLPRADSNGNRADMNKVGAEYAEYLSQRDTFVKNSSTHSPRHNLSAPQAANWAYGGNTGVPTNSPNGSGFGGNGRVNRVRVMPGNNNTIFACTASGGLWKTINGGISWSTNTDQLGDLTTSDIAINALDTNIMYLATGDGDGIQSIYPTPATIGVLKSYDGGNTWNATSLTYSLTLAGANDYSVNEILIDPNDTSVILAATTFGIWRSANSGATWTQTSVVGWFHSMEFHLGNPNIVYAATSNVINNLGGSFYRSTNNGVTWTNISSGLPANTVAEGMEIAVTAADTSLVYVLATRVTYYDFQGLYVSNNDGISFTQQSGYPTIPNILGRASNGNDYTVGQGWYDLAMSVSQTNKDSIWVGGINIWASTNGGVNWTLNADWFAQGAPFVHADIHHIQFIPGTNSKGYLVGCDGGVFITHTGGTSTWTNISHNLENSQQYCVGTSFSTHGLWITGWQDNGTNASFSPWGQVYGGDGTDCFIDWSNPAIMYAETPGAPDFIRSTNSGTSWSNITGGITDNGQWVTPWLQDPKTNTTLYCGINNVWKSVNSGTNWTRISAWGSAGHYMSALVVDSANVNYIYASYPNQLEYTANGGATWNNITGTLPVGSASITGIAVSAKSPSHVWVTFGGYSSGNEVFASTNFGATWTNISSGLPTLPVNCIVYESGSPNGIFVGTDQGVYYHDTISNGWTFYNTNLPLVMVANLKIWQPVKPTALFTASPRTICAGSQVQFTDTSLNYPEALIAATYGRGTWETPLYPPPALTWLWTFTGGNPATSNSQNPLVTYSSPGTYPVTLVITNRLGTSTVTKNLYITATASPSVAATINANIICNGGSNGSATVSASGGTLPYTYSWATSPAQTAANATGLSAGTYSVTVTDKNGCYGTASVTITEPLAMQATAIVTANVSCNGGNNGSDSSSVSGGTSPYTYSWTRGGTNITVSGLSAGNDTLRVTDINGCTTSAIATITQPGALALVKGYKPVSSSLDCNGSAWVKVSGGSSPYSYSWSPEYSSKDTITKKCCGEYCCKVIDDNGCADSVCINIVTNTGIQNVSNSSSVQIYPNPTNAIFTVEMKNGDMGMKSIEIYNVLGQKVYSSFFILHSSFDLSTQANGVYLIKILNSDGSMVTQQKMVKME